MKLTTLIAVTAIAAGSAASAGSSNFDFSTDTTPQNTAVKSGYSGFNLSDPGEIRISPNNDSR
jgi:hypothetical protein